MNKKQLVDELSVRTGMTKKDSANFVDSLFGVITESLVEGEKVAISGFGNFESRQRAERTGRNPLTGDLLTIPAKKTPAFKAAKALKDSIN